MCWDFFIKLTSLMNNSLILSLVVESGMPKLFHVGESGREVPSTQARLPSHYSVCYCDPGPTPVQRAVLSHHFKWFAAVLNGFIFYCYKTKGLVMRLGYPRRSRYDYPKIPLIWDSLQIPSSFDNISIIKHNVIN